MKCAPNRIHGCVLALFLLFLLIPSRLHAQDVEQGPPSIERYRRALEEANTLLQAEPPRLNQARQALAEFDRVMLSDGEAVRIAPLLGDPDTPLDVAAARLRLQTAIAQLDAAGADRTAERLAVLEEVLAGPQFQQRESLLDQLRRWLANLFDRLAPDVQPGAAANPLGASTAQVAGWIVIGGTAALLLFLLVRWLQTVLHTFVRDAQRAATDSGALPSTPAEARQAANRFAHGGDYRAAVRHLYLAALLTLQERRIVPRDPSLTNREVLARTPDDHPSHKPLQAVVNVFDDVWYGVHEPDADTFERYRRNVDALEHSAQDAAPQAKDSAQ